MTAIAQTSCGDFDLSRLTKSKRAVDLSPNTIRAYAKQGLPLYRQGKAVFFSRAELAQFIRTPKQSPAKPSKRKYAKAA